MKLVRETFTAASASNILLPQKRDREGLPSQTNDVLILVTLVELRYVLELPLHYYQRKTYFSCCDNEREYFQMKPG